VSGVKSRGSSAAAATRLASQNARPTSAASAWAARFGVAAMPPKAMRAPVIVPPSTVTAKPAATEEMSSSRRLEIL
jgi:hypothetical protein